MTATARIAAATTLACALCSFDVRADDLASLRAELDGLKSEYTGRIATLEKRIAELEAQAAAAPAVAAAAAPAPSGHATGTGTAFNPAMSVILAGSYAHLSQDPATYRIQGFTPAGDAVGPGPRSFNLGESELTFSSNVDPYFFANLTASITGENTISVEEAYFRTTALTGGFTIKGGRFFAGYGYLNDVHAHAWDFIDQPLAYQAFFNGQLSEDGVQLKWLAPTDMFIEFGAESGNGGHFPGTRRDRNGPNGGGLFMHLGDDIGDSASWRAGVSWVELSADNRGEFGGLVFAAPAQLGLPPVVAFAALDSFTGSSRTWVVDATLKWAPHGNPTVHSLKVQGEYLRRSESGTLDLGFPVTSPGTSYSAVQSGWYLQSVYQFRPRWRVGLRYDYLDSGTPNIGLPGSSLASVESFLGLTPAVPRRLTWMLDWSPSEFSRLRAQFAWDDARATVRDRQLFLQYLYSIGAHGAHKF